jgi:hypothetical protein
VLFPGYSNRIRRQCESIDGIQVVRVWSYLAPNAGIVRRIANFLSYMLMATWTSLWMRKPDVIVATSPQFFCGWAGVFASKIRRVPFVLEVRDIWPESIVAVGAMKNKHVLKILEFLEKCMYRAASHIVTVGNGYRENILTKVDVAQRCTVITNGVDLARFQDVPDNRAIDLQWKLSGKFTCFYIGTVGLAHGLHVVPNATKILLDRGRKDFCFCIVGDGAARAATQKMVHEMQLEDFVVFFGNVQRSEIPSILNRADASLVHLRKTDLFTSVIPSKIFETMAMGCPIIMGVDGESRKIVIDAQAAIVMEPENAKDLADAVEKLADNRALCKQLGKHGRSYVAEHYDRNRLALEYLALLQSVASQ